VVDQPLFLALAPRSDPLYVVEELGLPAVLAIDSLSEASANPQKTGLELLSTYTATTAPSSPSVGSCCG